MAARTAITVNRPARNAATDLGTIAAPANGVAIDQANGMVVAPKRAHKLALVVYNSKVSGINVTVRKGVYPPSEDSGKGDLTVAVATIDLTVIGPFDGSRFLQQDGSINVDFDAGSTGEIWAIEMPA